jgi:hypothetical protein
MLVVAGYFAYLAGLAVIRPVPARPRNQVLGVSLAMLAAVATIGMPHVMPLVYLLVGYWLPALLVSEPTPRLERSLSTSNWRICSAMRSCQSGTPCYSSAGSKVRSSASGRSFAMASAALGL